MGDVRLDPKEPKKLAAEPGSAAIYNGPAGKAKDLTSKETFGDVELHAEFVVPKGSNSGIKFQAVYEVQIFDSFGVKAPKGTDSGAVYPRSELKPKYHHIDDGHPPLVNASKAPGEWQTLELTFIAPRFDASGQKVADARITAILNGQKVQDDRKVECPTGSNWRKKEVPTGPILLQGDHGPVSFRNVRPAGRRLRMEKLPLDCRAAGANNPMTPSLTPQESRRSHHDTPPRPIDRSRRHRVPSAVTAGIGDSAAPFRRRLVGSWIANRSECWFSRCSPRRSPAA